jgi:hypothetical protein
MKRIIFLILGILFFTGAFSQKKEVTTDQFNGDKTIKYSIGGFEMTGFSINVFFKGQDTTFYISFMQNIQSYDYINNYNGELKSFELLKGDGTTVEIIKEYGVKGIINFSNVTSYFVLAFITIEPNMLNDIKGFKSYRIAGIGKGVDYFSEKQKKKMDNTIDLFLNDYPNFK